MALCSSLKFNYLSLLNEFISPTYEKMCSSLKFNYLSLLNEFISPKYEKMALWSSLKFMCEVVI